MNLAGAQLALGRYERAVDHYEQALEVQEVGGAIAIDALVCVFCCFAP
jgi:hypothetical protein